ncbi:MAG TPA: CDP-alcohol phosphatidyltransferase family protein [Candidatus Kapabacteria bacterium]|nr:CDP-alcohol phosphatidyltransferase family protein [Candidatus Kapabacteria bacterium]
MHTTFGGDKKVGQSLLGPLEKRLVTLMTPHVPQWLSTSTLTYSTILWSLLIILFSFLAQWDIRALWMVSFMIFLQWLTDSLDGAVGRYRNTGLIRWGYYMDHFLDYIFLCSILIGYSFILPDHFKYLLFFILAIFGAFMVNSYLSFAATNEFRISYLGIGPTEIRLVFITINTLLILFGTTHLAFALPYVLGFSLFGLCVVVARASSSIWKIDMDRKKDATHDS